MSEFKLGGMACAPQLAAYAQTLALPGVGQLHYYDSAPANPLAGHPRQATTVLIHGLQDEADSWRHVFEPLAQQQRVLAPDLPGFGRSDKSRRRYSIPFYADVLLGWMDCLQIPYATLIGNSLGAIIAEHIALSHAARVARLVLVDGTLRLVERPQRTPPLWRQLLAGYFDRKYFEALRKDPQAAYDSLQPYYGDLAALPEADRRFLFQRVNERVWDEDQRLAALSIQTGFAGYFLMQAPRLMRMIPSSPVPTRVIWGERDYIVPLKNGQQRAAAQRNTELRVIVQAGHLPQQEAPTHFLAALGF